MKLVRTIEFTCFSDDQGGIFVFFSFHFALFNNLVESWEQSIEQQYGWDYDPYRKMYYREIDALLPPDDDDDEEVFFFLFFVLVINVITL